jgi:NAD(P)-dependent dehydrogenase (short-subunit alcohol dehydrogenase family)
MSSQSRINHYGSSEWKVVCYDLSMQIAVVSGVSYGIGKSIAKVLLSNGWKVYGIARTKPLFEDINFVWLPCDLSVPEEIEHQLAQIKEVKIDALISNAGVIYLGAAVDETEDTYDSTYLLNVLAPILLVHYLAAKLKKSKIISISSVSDRIPEAEMALYCSSKAANTSFFNSLAKEMKNAQVICLLPDYVDTPMLHSTMDADKTFDWKTALQPEAIADLTYRLLSEDIKVKSGSNIIINNNALQADIRDTEELFAFNTDTDKLTSISHDTTY